MRSAAVKRQRQYLLLTGARTDPSGASTVIHSATCEIRRILAERGREVDEVFLFLSEDFADVFRNGVFAERLALPDAFAIGTNGVALVLQVRTQHFFRLLRLLDRLRRSGRHAAQI